MKTSTTFSVFLAVHLFLFQAACVINTGESIDPTFANVQDIFTGKCALLGCHNGAQIPDLRNSRSYNSIVNQPSSTGELYVKPGDSSNSYLYRKITGDEGILGTRMPRGISIEQNEIDAIENWIDNGADP